ncbi:MAG: MFS transporter [Opitutaceae bacterium]
MDDPVHQPTNVPSTTLAASPAVEQPAARFTLSRTFAALRHRNYRLFFFGQLVSLVGTWMQNVAQAWLVYVLTGSPFKLGVVSFCAGVPVLAFSLWAGVVADRVPKRRLLLLTQTAMMTLAFLLAADMFLGTLQWWHIALLAFLLGTANAFDAPARQAFVVEMVGRRELMNAIALNSAMFNAARIIGPALAGVTLAAIGTRWCFVLNGVSFLAVIAGLALMDVRPYVGAAATESPFRQMRDGISYIWHHPTVRPLITLVAVSNMFALGYMALLPALAQDILHAGTVGYGLMSTAIGMGALAGALVIASLGNYQHKGLVLTAGNLLFPTMVLAVALSRSYHLTLGLLVVAGLGFMTQNATANTLVQTTVPDGLRGRVMSVYMMVFLGFFPIGSLIAGSVAEKFGVPAGAAFGGVMALLYSLYLFWRIPQIRALR